jgi:hypothetical protein
VSRKLLEQYERTWTKEQWADAERTANEIAALSEDVDNEGLTCLVIEERKRDPKTTIGAALFVVTALGVESMFEIRREAENPKAKKPIRKKAVRGVRGV